MKLRTISYLVIGFCSSALMAMDNKPISLTDYTQVLKSGDCLKIVEATKALWPAGQVGIHIVWQDFTFKVRGDQKVLSDGTYFNDTAHRKALLDYIMKDILHPALFGTVGMGETLTKIDQLSKNIGIFAADLAPSIMKYMIIVAQCPNRTDMQEWNIKSNKLSPLDDSLRRSLSTTITNVGAYTGETNLFTGKLPFKIRAYYHRYLIGFFCAAAACIGSLIAYKKYQAKNEETDTKGNSHDEVNLDQRDIA